MLNNLLFHLTVGSPNCSFGILVVQKNLNNPNDTIYMPRNNPIVKPTLDQRSIKFGSIIIYTKIILLSGCMFVHFSYRSEIGYFFSYVSILRKSYPFAVTPILKGEMNHPKLIEPHFRNSCLS